MSSTDFRQTVHNVQGRQGPLLDLKEEKKKKGEGVDAPRNGQISTILVQNGGNLRAVLRARGPRPTVAASGKGKTKRGEGVPNGRLPGEAGITPRRREIARGASYAAPKEGAAVEGALRRGKGERKKKEGGEHGGSLSAARCPISRRRCASRKKKKKKGGMFCSPRERKKRRGTKKSAAPRVERWISAPTASSTKSFEEVEQQQRTKQGKREERFVDDAVVGGSPR